VVVDGVLEQCSTGEGLSYIEKAQSLYPNWLHCEIEGDGAGDTFFTMCLMKPNLKVVMSKTGGRDKAYRLVELMGPWLRLGKVRISDASTPFLNALRNFLNKYPAVVDKDPGWDAADAVYRALVAMPDVLAMEPRRDSLRTPSQTYRQQHENPWTAIARA